MQRAANHFHTALQAQQQKGCCCYLHQANPVGINDLWEATIHSKTK
jgi:hypothetical protein